MSKDYISLGLMSGTSGDGIDASIIQTNGSDRYKVLSDKYYKYNNETYRDIHSLKDQINLKRDLTKHKDKILKLEKNITLIHAQAVKDISRDKKIDTIGFHGQTIYHNSKERISQQLGDGMLLSQLSGKSVVYNFRENDIKNEGQGAPLSPIFHNLIVKQNKLKPPICILNIGGIANITNIFSEDTLDFESHDIGPGNCLIDEWIRKNSKFQYDHDSLFANNGNINEIILEQAQELFANKPIEKKISLDTKDFDVSFARGLSLEDGSATLTYLTASIISENLNSMTIGQINQNVKILLCGGGRKNKLLIDTIKKKIKKNLNLELIDKHNIDGDFIESQAFAYLAIRSLLKYPISFPRTTGCKIPISGGDIVKIK